MDSNEITCKSKIETRKDSTEALVSVIIPTWDRRDDLKRALASVDKQEGVRYEIIVVDNGSTDNSYEMVASQFPEVKVVRNEKNIGTGMAKDQGILQSKGDYCHFLDSDAELVEKHCLKNMVDLLSCNADIGGIGSELYIGLNGEVEHKKKAITFNGETFTSPVDINEYKLLEVGYMPTCNMMISRDLLFKCGGFDPFIVYAGEDKELGYKIKSRGYRNVIDSRCLAYHRFSREGRKSNFYLYNRNRIRFVIKNSPWLTVIFLPILDLISLTSMKRFRSIKGKDIDVTRWEHKTDFSKIGTLFTVLKLGFSYLVSLLRAYVWNFVFLPRTLKERFLKKSYLEALSHDSSR